MSRAYHNMPRPTVEDLRVAHRAFCELEPRDLFYRLATESMDRAIKGTMIFNTVEALAVLLQTWNKRYYIKQRKFNVQHFKDIECIVSKYQQYLLTYRERTIDGLSDQDKSQIKEVFVSFSNVH